MRIIEDKYGNRFLEIENKEDFRKFKEGTEEIVKKSIKKVYDGSSVYFLIPKDS